MSADTAAPSPVGISKEDLEKDFPGIFYDGTANRDALYYMKSCMMDCFNDSDITKHWETIQRDLNQAIESGVALGQIKMPADKAAFKLDGRDFAMPLSLKDATDLYQLLSPSLVGVEKRGDVLDDNLRRSHEVVATSLSLSSQLQAFDFPEELERMRTHLCPSAEKLRMVPYKLIVYGKGDFFVPHRDSMDCAEMIGSMSLMLPLEPAAFRGDPANDPKEETGYRRREKERVGKPGQLVMYVGCHPDDETETALRDRKEQRPANPLTYTVDMEQQVVDGTDPNSALTMNYGAWNGDVLHEVRELENGYRAVLVYRIYKVGHRADFVPESLRKSTEAQVRGMLEILKHPQIHEDYNDYDDDNDDGNDHNKDNDKPAPNFYLGFALRHAYPPAALLPSALKGIDAILYSIVADHYKCALFTGYEARFKDFDEIHCFEKTPFEKTVYFTRETPEIDFYDEECLEEMTDKYPLIQNTAWVQLGYGELLGGGFCYGNMDCGTDWWYRQGYLLLRSKSE